jgi:stress-induced-phosphoprotein 1
MSSAGELKAQGNAFLSSGDHLQAVECYTKAIALDDTQHVFYSNRSAAYLSAGDGEKALLDAESCITKSPSWTKGYARKGAALHFLKKYDDAVAAYQEGLALEPDNAACLSGLQTVQAEQSAPPSNPFANIFGADLPAKMAGNPRLSGYLSDPQVMAKVQHIQSDPNSLNSYLKDPAIMSIFAEMMGLNMSSGPPSASSGTHTEEPEPMQEEEEVVEISEEDKATALSLQQAAAAKTRYPSLSLYIYVSLL